MPSIKSRSLKRRVKRVPGGGFVTHYTKPNHKALRCSRCGKPLHGIPRESTLRTKLSKSERRPNRPYGGVLCSRCLRELIKGVSND